MKVRRRLRLLPEVQALVETLWTIAAPKGETPRMALKSYMDYHLSCYHFITSIDQEEDDDGDDEGVDLFDAWETAVRDWRADTTAASRCVTGAQRGFGSNRNTSDGVAEVSVGNRRRCSISVALLAPISRKKWRVGARLCCCCCGCVL